MTGGLAIHLHLEREGILSPRPVLDLDLVAVRPDAVAPSVVSDFLVSHYHLPTQKKPKFLIQLVDPTSRCRVDVFPDMHGSLTRAVPESFGGITICVVQAADILDHKLQTLRTASRERPVDPKHHEHAVALGRLLGRDVPSVPGQDLSIDQYSSELEQRCRRCDESRSTAFPLASKQEIFEVLGYV
ncbi:MAG: hypothetical protein WEG36_07865 [Gemmatimonadota bacterium]